MCSSAHGKCSCSGIRCGSGHFVQNFSTFLNSSGVGFHGALILETILNHNTTPNSQNLPQSLQLFLPAVYNEVSKNNFSGDFLAVIGRLANDEGLIKGITNAFKKDGKYSLFNMDRPRLRDCPQNYAVVLKATFLSELLVMFFMIQPRAISLIYPPPHGEEGKNLLSY